MKKSILFVIESLDCAGAEKSLVTLLNLLDYSKYNVDLMLFSHGGMLESLVPDKVNILEPLNYSQFSKLNLKDAFIYSIFRNELKMLTSRLRYSIEIRKKKYSNPQKARIFWEEISKVIEKNPKVYDVAISYSQGIPTFYGAEKVKAKMKYTWVNVSYRLNEFERNFQKKYYDSFDKVIAVSETTKEIFNETFPEYKEKLQVIYDINNPKFISDMAMMEDGFQDSFDGIRILTIGRLAHQKGYDLALAACKKLKDAGIKFQWYALGKGPLKSEIEELIHQYGLQEHFILLGVKSNPYPYIRNSDIYVQTSRFEGFGIAIAEARMLNIPVVTTKFDAVYNQMIDRKNGLVVEQNAEAVFLGIMELITNPILREKIVSYLQTERKGNIKEIEKVYELID